MVSIAATRTMKFAGKPSARLKTDPATASIPVILMSSARLCPADRAGADAFLTKPFELEALEVVLQRWLEGRPAQPPGAEPVR